MSFSHPHYSLVFIAIIFFRRTCALSWSFVNPPTQCGDLTLSIDGAGGSPPYKVLVVPVGFASYEGSNYDPRPILDVSLSGMETKVQFHLPYMADSEFVTVVSDSRGFGSCGTSIATKVAASNDTSCLQPKGGMRDDFYFSIYPPNQYVQCQDMRIAWDPKAVVGTPSFYGVIPGGQSFTIPQGEITTVQAMGTGFTWTPSIRGGTTFVLLGGDSRRQGNAGRTQNVVSHGEHNNVACLSPNSPSSTPGPPAGFSPTATMTTASVTQSVTQSVTATTTTIVDGDPKTSLNLGVIAGAVGGCVALVIIGVLVCLCRRRRQRDVPLDLSTGIDAENVSPYIDTRQHQYQPEPPLAPPPVNPPPPIPLAYSHIFAERPSHWNTNSTTPGSHTYSTSIPSRGRVPAYGALHPEQPAPLHSNYTDAESSFLRVDEIPPAYTPQQLLQAEATGAGRIPTFSRNVK